MKTNKTSEKENFRFLIELVSLSFDVRKESELGNKLSNLFRTLGEGGWNRFGFELRIEEIERSVEYTIKT